jgi:pantoate--beta-alanine ligase
LHRAAQAVQAGQKDFAAVEAEAASSLTKSGWVVDYVSIRSANTLLSPTDSEKELVVLGAARLDGTRLIDNIELKVA